MSRPVQPFGTYGAISVRKTGAKYAATARYRDLDGNYTRIQATDATAAKATNALKAKITEYAASGGDSDINRHSSLADVATFWMEEARADQRQSPQTLDVYERNLETVILPVLGNLRLRELTVGRVDRFLKAIRDDHPSRARRAKVVLSLILDLAVRHDAVPKNTVRDAAPVPRTRKDVRALDQNELRAWREAVKGWRTDGHVRGPRPDGQLSAVLETILGTSARIGEALAIRKCDVDMVASPPTVTISGTLVYRNGVGLYRQPHPKHSKEWRIIAVPSYTAEVIRSRLAGLADKPDDHPLFCTKKGTFIAPGNLRRQLRDVRAAAGFTGSVDLDDLTPHTFRKTVATTINHAASSDLAAELLGHASKETTENYYIQPTKRVNPATAAILERLAPHDGAGSVTLDLGNATG